MNLSVLTPILITGFTVAFFHAAIPTHWLPFVMAGRVQQWGKGKTLLVTALAGVGHVIMTTALGLLIVWLGLTLDEKIGAVFPWVAGGILIAFGCYYLIRHFMGHTHGHHHHGPNCKHHSHASLHEFKGEMQSDVVAITSLFALLTFSPCEGFLPVYISGITYGWLGFSLLSAVLAGGTLLGMMVFTWLSLIGMERLKMSFLEKHESSLMGGLLCVLGILVIVVEST